MKYLCDLTQEEFDQTHYDMQIIYLTFAQDALKRIVQALSGDTSINLLHALEALPGFLLIPLLEAAIGKKNIPALRLQMIAQMSDEQILTAWDDLTYYDPKRVYLGLTMDDWAEMIYHEKSKRGL